MNLWPHRKIPSEPPLLFAAPADDPDSGRLILIGEARRGAACNAVCPACKEPVIARQGNHRTHHFAHASGKSCIGSAETALHRFAKEVIAKAGGLMLPTYTHEHRGLRETLVHAGWVQFDEVQLEVGLEGMRPDLIGIKMGSAGSSRRLLIEIHVTHAVDPIKLARIKDQGLSAIEINLTNLDRFADPQTIADAILWAAPRAWLHHARTPEVSRRLSQEADRIAARRRANIADMVNLILNAATQAKSDSNNDLEQIEMLGLYGFITDQPWSQLAHETSRSLQARILLHCYQTFLRAPYPDKVEVPLTTIRKLFDLAGCLPDWLDEKRDWKAIAAAQARDKSLLAPEAMIRRLMDALVKSKALALERHGRIHYDHYVIGSHLHRIIVRDREAALLRAERVEPSAPSMTRGSS